MKQSLMNNSDQSRISKPVRSGGKITHMDEIARILRWLMANDPNVSGNQTALSNATGVSQPTIYRLLRGEVRDPRSDTLKHLADYFGITTAQLRGEAQIPGGPEVHRKIGDLEPTPSLTPAERRLLALYRSLSDDGRVALEAHGDLVKRLDRSVH